MTMHWVACLCKFLLSSAAGLLPGLLLGELLALALAKHSVSFHCSCTLLVSSFSERGVTLDWCQCISARVELGELALLLQNSGCVIRKLWLHASHVKFKYFQRNGF